MPSAVLRLLLVTVSALAVLGAAEPTPAPGELTPATAAELVAVPPSAPSSAFGEKLEKAVAAFEAKDKTAPPTPGTIEFIGSSTFTRWGSLKQDFAPLPVYNRGFGGSRVEHVLAAVPRIVLPYKPAVIVYYCGDNNLHPAGKAEPAPIVKGFTDFVAAVHAAQPATRIIYLSIKPSPRRWDSWSEAQAVNSAVKAYCASDATLSFADIGPALLTPDGQVDPSLYVEDKLHMTAAGYVKVTAVLKPIVEAAWNQVKH